MSDRHPPQNGNTKRINFDASATFRKWPSLNGQRRTDSAGPYLLLDGTLDECIRQFLTKPIVTRHLYEIHTAPQPPMVSEVLAGETVAELARLLVFFEVLTPTNGSPPLFKSTTD
jgi:hypothetical protein